LWGDAGVGVIHDLFNYCYSEATMSDGTKRRGFASMSPERRKQVTSMGGKAAWKKGVARHFSPEEARQAGAKGLASRRRKKS
jgi:hypothetical protein